MPTEQAPRSTEQTATPRRPAPKKPQFPENRVIKEGTDGTVRKK
jgi:hypothetical protein